MKTNAQKSAPVKAVKKWADPQLTYIVGERTFFSGKTIRIFALLADPASVAAMETQIARAIGDWHRNRYGRVVNEPAILVMMARQALKSIGITKGK